MCMEYYLILVPVLIFGTLGTLVWYYKREELEENLGPYLLALCLPVLFTLLLIVTMSGIMRSNNFVDTEYLSGYFDRIRHEDEWDEWIERTCTEQVKVGEDSDGNPIYEEREYDCSYREYHPERWMKYEHGSSWPYYINEEEFEKLRLAWGTKMRFINMHRDYYRIDGDAQEYDWNKSWQSCDTYTETHRYENRILGSQSVLGYKKISKEEAGELGLREYSTDTPILGYPANKWEIQRFNYINAVYGKSKQIHIFILIWPSTKYNVSIVEDQKAYWQGGNKNEFIICLGLKGKKIDWAQCFSWQDDITFDVKCRSWLMEQKQLDLYLLADWIENNLGLWRRKEFKDFSYIQSFLSEGQMSAITWTVIILNVLGGIVIGILIFNGKFDNGFNRNFRNSSFRRYNY